MSSGPTPKSLHHVAARLEPRRRGDPQRVLPLLAASDEKPEPEEILRRLVAEGPVARPDEIVRGGDLAAHDALAVHARLLGGGHMVGVTTAPNFAWPISTNRVAISLSSSFVRRTRQEACGGEEPTLPPGFQYARRRAG